MKIPTAQLAALRTIAAGGVTAYAPPSYTGRRSSVAVPEGARPIIAAVADRLRESDLIGRRGMPPGSAYSRGTHYELYVTPRGADLLAGVTRPPVKLVTTIAARAAEHAHARDAYTIVVTTEIDAYTWDRWAADDVERERRIAKLNATAISDHITATTTVKGEAR